MVDTIINTFITDMGMEIKGHYQDPPRNAIFSNIPSTLHPSVYNLAKKIYPTGIYSHQAEAINAFLKSENICLATPTASGKSLVFMLSAAHVIKTCKNSKVLALYPAKALIQDQIQKWSTILSPLGISIEFIDGSVNVDQREAIVQKTSIILMTPDVAHAWLLRKLDKPKVRSFMSSLKLLIADEVHVYDGVFGTNMAYFLRRLQIASDIKNIVVSTATIGEPIDFMKKITGRDFVLIDESKDGAGSKGRDVYCIDSGTLNTFDGYVKLIKSLMKENLGRFIAFADSRKMVEMLVVSLHRDDGQQDNQEQDANSSIDDVMPDEELLNVLPYRAGYEEQDRKEIQTAIEKGKLSGVIATSALELGIDIQDLDIVILLGVPPSTKAFKQRLGRVGRHKHGVCLLIDDKGILSDSQVSWLEYIDKKSEPNWLYLENKYIQYTNVLCASLEFTLNNVSNEKKQELFSTLPEQFSKLLANELEQTEDIPTDLYPYKQRGQDSPHLEFPLRAGLEPSLKIKYKQGGFSRDYGTINFSQSLKEAYPGAVYYYMARPYRVYEYSLRKSEIFIKREKQYTTEPILQVMVFPKFQNNIIQLKKAHNGFLVESDLQVNERVSGFNEKRGGNSFTILYEKDCIYAQRPVVRYFETTGVCWFFSDKKVIDKTVASLIYEVFCLKFGIQNRDIGCEIFHTKNAPNGIESCTGFCIFDRTSGSLRITQQLFTSFEQIIESAISMYSSSNNIGIEYSHDIAEALQTILVYAKGLSESDVSSSDMLEDSSKQDDEWQMILASGSDAYLVKDSGEAEEINIKGYRYTPKGLMYELTIERDGSRLVSSKFVNAIPEKSTYIRVNLYTGEERPC